MVALYLSKPTGFRLIVPVLLVQLMRYGQRDVAGRIDSNLRRLAQDRPNLDVPSATTPTVCT